MNGIVWKMELQIFENEAIDFNEVNFKLWLTEDGEWMEIEELSDKEIMDAIYTLKRKIKMLPEHVNSDIWEEYLYVLQNEIRDREG